MAVYVDDMEWPFGRMLMCHMVADRHTELVAMAKAIGVQVKWIQHGGTYREHFDISKGMRAKAVRLGAVEISYLHDYPDKVDAKRDIDVFAEYWDLRCGTCRRIMNMSEDCGGDCSTCVAEAEAGL